jgi:uncharacterized protein YjbI with pentapeptide repeats
MSYNYNRSIWRENDRMSGRDLSGENFDHVVFDGADMSNSNFSFGSFRFATFKNCNFENSNFYGADLTGCSFGYSNFVGVNLEAAKVSFTTSLPPSGLWFIRKVVVHNGPITATLEKLDRSIQDRVNDARILKAQAQAIPPAAEEPKPIETTMREYGDIMAELDRATAEMAKTFSTFIAKTCDILAERHQLRGE